MITRRRFLRDLGVSTALVLAGRLLADPYTILAAPSPRRGWQPVRVRGRVTVDGTGRSGVAVSDGRSVARTVEDGSYSLVADPDQPFVFATIPAGTRIPLTRQGTALFHQPLVAKPSSEQTISFAFESLPEGDHRHHLFLLADPQTQDARDIARLHRESVPGWSAEAKRIGPATCFAVGCGDIMYDRLEHFPEYERALRAASLPGFQVVGNHDLDMAARSDEASIRTFERHFGPTYYSFDRGEIHYVVLDDVFWHGRGYLGYLDQRQLDWLTADVEALEKGARVVVCLHIPPLSTHHTRRGFEEPEPGICVVNREVLYERLARFRTTILCGHMHEIEFLKDGGCGIHVCGAVCGAWWTGPICYDGAPNGWMIYEVVGSELRPRYQAAGHPAEHQMRLYRLPGEAGGSQVLANVWAATPEWKIDWYEDGERRGRMKQRRSRDPLSVELHEGDRKPSRRKWIEPVGTDHTFVAVPSTGTSPVTVEATDPWGRVFRETLTR